MLVLLILVATWAEVKQFAVVRYVAALFYRCTNVVDRCTNDTSVTQLSALKYFSFCISLPDDEAEVHKMLNAR
jgi:hypothetical protein